MANTQDDVTSTQDRWAIIDRMSLYADFLPLFDLFHNNQEVSIKKFIYICTPIDDNSGADDTGA